LGKPIDAKGHKSTLVEFGSVEDGSKCLRDGYFCLGVAAFYWVFVAITF
jgi:hypothetical protein